VQLAPDLSRVATVSNLVLHRDAATFVLEKGELALARPIEGRVCAAYFAGKGRIHVSPGQEIERAELRAWYKTPELDQEFVSLMLLFADSTAEELAAAVELRPGRFDHVRTTSDENTRGLVDKSIDYIDPSLGRSLLEHRRTAYFAAMTVDEEHRRLRYVIDPYATEEVSLSRLVDGAGPRITRFRLGGLSSDSLASDFRPAFSILSYRIDVTLGQAMTPYYVAEMGCKVLEDSVRFLPFWLSDLGDSPDSTGNQAGEIWPVFGHKGSDLVWVDAGRELRRGEAFRMHMRYHGSPLGDWLNLPLLHSHINWYPVHDFANRAFFDLTFHYERPLDIVCVGDSLAHDEDPQGRVVSRWRTPEPISNAFWHVGEFKFTVAQADSAPEIRLVNYAGSQAQITWDVQRMMGINAGKVLEKPVGHDVLTSIKFFQRAFGPLTASHLYAMESYDAHGEAFPDLILLDWKTFHGTDTEGADEVLRAHEVAHQWWGYAVRPKTYRDHWLSEGLAEFSALWYTQAKRNDTPLYLRSLADMREKILDIPDLAPIWVGARSGSRYPYYKAFVAATYFKGAWVCHMLRCMLIDFDTMDETRFTELMREFASGHRGGGASTLDFEGVATRAAGEPMDWFFQQWVRGSAIPTYRYAWRQQAVGDGKYAITLHVEQRGVPDGFRMPVPIRIELADGMIARTRVWVDKPVVDVTFSSLSAEPKALVFNEFSGVLCRTETTDR